MHQPFVLEWHLVIGLKNPKLNKSLHDDKRVTSFMKMLPITCINETSLPEINEKIGQQLSFGELIRFLGIIIFQSKSECINMG